MRSARPAAEPRPDHLGDVERRPEDRDRGRARARATARAAAGTRPTSSRARRAQDREVRRQRASEDGRSRVRRRPAAAERAARGLADDARRAPSRSRRGRRRSRRRSASRNCSATSTVASRGPTTAPALSIAWWNPNARPARLPAASAMSASRGELRMPLPTRSVTRTASTCQGRVARAMKRSRGAREPVAEEHQRLAPRHAVRDDARDELEQARDGVGRALHEAEVRRARRRAPR